MPSTKDDSKVAMDKILIDTLIKSQEDAVKRYDDLVASFAKLETRIASPPPMQHLQSRAHDSVLAPSMNMFTLSPADAATSTRSMSSLPVAQHHDPVHHQLAICASSVSQLVQTLDSASHSWKERQQLDYDAIQSHYIVLGGHLDMLHTHHLWHEGINFVSPEPSREPPLNAFSPASFATVYKRPSPQGPEDYILVQRSRSRSRSWGSRRPSPPRHRRQHFAEAATCGLDKAAVAGLAEPSTRRPAGDDETCGQQPQRRFGSRDDSISHYDQSRRRSRSRNRSRSRSRGRRLSWSKHSPQLAGAVIGALAANSMVGARSQVVADDHDAIPAERDDSHVSRERERERERSPYTAVAGSEMNALSSRDGFAYSLTSFDSFEIQKCWVAAERPALTQPAEPSPSGSPPLVASRSFRSESDESERGMELVTLENGPVFHSPDRGSVLDTGDIDVALGFDANLACGPEPSDRFIEPVGTAHDEERPQTRSTVDNLLRKWTTVAVL